MADNTVRFRAVLDDKVSKPLGTIDKGFKKLEGNKKATALLQGVGLGAGVSAFNLIGSAASVATDAIFSSIDAASNLRESISLSTQVFGANESAIETWASTAAESFGTSKREALTFAATFGTAFKNVGFSLDDTTDKAETMTRLAADLGSAFNASSDEAATALRSGLLGESEPLRRFGVFLDEAKTKAKALALGFKPVNGAFTDNAKVAARYALILEQTTDSQGMFGRDTESLADAQKSLGAALEDVQAEIGTALLPVMRDLAVWMRTEGIPVAKEFFDVLFSNKAKDDDVVGTAFVHLTEDLNTLAHASQDFGSSIHEALFPPSFNERIQQQQAAIDGLTDTVGTDATLLSTHGSELRDRLGGAFDHVGTTATGAATSTEKATARMTAAMDALRNSAITNAEDAVDGYYNVLITQDNLAATNAEIAAQERIISSSTATAAEKRDARSRLHQLQADQAGFLKTLASAGKSTTTEFTKSMETLQKRLTKAHGAEAAAIREEIRLLNLLAAKAALAKLFDAGSGYTTFGGGRAAGGPVSAGTAYVVGENRPELFVPKTNGYILPSVPSGGSSGTTVVHTHVYLDGTEIAESVDTVQRRDLQRIPRSALTTAA